MEKSGLPFRSSSLDRKSSRPPKPMEGFSSLFGESSKRLVEGGGGADARRLDVKDSEAGMPENPISKPLPLNLASSDAVEEIKSLENKLSDGAEDTSLVSFGKSILKGSDAKGELSTLASTEEEGVNPADVRLENRSSPEFFTWAIMSSTNPTAAAWVFWARLPIADERGAGGGGPPPNS